MTPNTVRRRRNRFHQRSPMGQPIGSERADLILCDYLESLPSARALTSWLLYKYGEHSQLVHLTCDPLDYNSPGDFRAAYAATKFFSKTPGLKTGVDTKAVALESAEEAERKNRLTNDTIVAIREGHASDLYGSEIYQAIQKIADVLGPVPTWTIETDAMPDAVMVEVETILVSHQMSRSRLSSVEQIVQSPSRGFVDVGWSPGRTSSASGDSVTGYEKYRSRADVTVRGRAAALRLLNGSPWWGASVLQTDAPVSVLPRALSIIGGNTLLTVPKSAKTDRVICFEPHMNIRAQLAVGGYIRRRLSKAGINLNDQSINRRRACLASRTGSMATLDLSAASDTVSRELIYELLPIDWACLLDDLRSHYTLWPDGTWRHCEKFSSMGNGFTFELESLVFYALASAVTSNVSVYGDDIIVPTKAYADVVRLLTACGFQVNVSKSFSSGQFRESCGGDYFSGHDCTPVYLRQLPKTVWDVMKLHNQVRRFAAAFHPERRVEVMLRKWRTMYPSTEGPSGFGDGHYHVDWDWMTPIRDLNQSQVEGWWYRTYVPVVPQDDWFDFAPALCAALGPKRPLDLSRSAIRRRVKYRMIWGLGPHEWPDVLWV